MNYWTEYTGNSNHGVHSDTFNTIHDTRLRINYTYYNSSEVFERICEWYDKIDPGMSFDYTVIDDGSQKDPIDINYVPDYWTILRIDTDHGWNNEGARNCLMQHTDNKWNLVLDSDWVITRKNLFNIRFNLSDLPDNVVYMPGNYGRGTMRNSYLVSKQEFWNRGGYDQAFIGYHGNDYSFLRFGLKYDHSDWFSLTRIVDDVIDPEDKQRLEHVKAFHQHMIDLESKGYGYRNPEDKQDFIWTDIEEQKRRWLDLEYVQLR